GESAGHRQCGPAVDEVRCLVFRRLASLCGLASWRARAVCPFSESASQRVGEPRSPAAFAFSLPRPQTYFLFPSSYSLLPVPCIIVTKSSPSHGSSLDSLEICLRHPAGERGARRHSRGTQCVARRSGLRLLQPDRLDR